ncbi:hypothetical protein Trco_008026 [Trichoderma cornu-damae]|uniref:Uncharacterized protein n=1 Tax=Trichoderma cornu-damae TaxID=654480 RepID=A0A9P8QDS9_9HYPO|nr:hypothetical protein Trco_008026 [Trichoderma cornu-damae]
MTNILWLRQLFDRFHSRIFTFREGHHPEDKSSHIQTHNATMPEEKSSLRPPRPPEADPRQRSRTQVPEAAEARRDASRSTDVPSEEDITAREMEHQRYGEAQPQLVPTDVIETMITAKGRKTDSLGGA